jgi:hypothetical protein
LRAGLAVAVGALLALALGQLLGSLFPVSRPLVSDHFTPLVAHAADRAEKEEVVGGKGPVGRAPRPERRWWARSPTS